MVGFIHHVADAARIESDAHSLNAILSHRVSMRHHAHTMEHEMEEAIKSGRVVVQVASEAEKEQVSILQQGSLALNTEEMLMQRLSLRDAPETVALLAKFWRVAQHEMLQRSTQTGSELDRAGYTVLFTRVHRVLLPEETAAEMVESIAQDWDHDAKGAADSIDERAIGDALFELADVWVPTCELRDYEDFLRRLLASVVDDNFAKSGSQPAYRPLEECTHDEDHLLQHRDTIERLVESSSLPTVNHEAHGASSSRKQHHSRHHSGHHHSGHHYSSHRHGSHHRTSLRTKSQAIGAISHREFHTQTHRSADYSTSHSKSQGSGALSHRELHTQTHQRADYSNVKSQLQTWNTAWVKYKAKNSWSLSQHGDEYGYAHLKHHVHTLAKLLLYHSRLQPYQHAKAHKHRLHAMSGSPRQRRHVHKIYRHHIHEYHVSRDYDKPWQQTRKPEALAKHQEERRAGAREHQEEKPTAQERVRPPKPPGTVKLPLISQHQTAVGGPTLAEPSTPTPPEDRAHTLVRVSTPPQVKSTFSGITSSGSQRPRYYPPRQPKQPPRPADWWVARGQMAQALGDVGTHHHLQRMHSARRKRVSCESYACDLLRIAADVP